MITVPVNNTPEGAIAVRLVTDSDRDAPAIGKTLTLKWAKAGAAAWTTLTVSTHYTVVNGPDGIYWVTFADSDLFDTVGGAVLEITAADTDEYYERFQIYTPANVAATPATLSSAERNAVADHTLRRSIASARESSNGDSVSQRSLLGQIAKYVNRTRINGSSLEIYQEDDSTLYYSQAVTTNEAAAPIVEVD